MVVHIHPQALCESASVGDGTTIWAFAHVLPFAVIGEQVNLCDHVFVENDVVIGDRVTVKSGVQLWDGVRLGDDVFVGPNVTFTNDRFPRSRQYLPQPLVTTVHDGASIGANATVLPGVTIGRGAMVGAGAVVTKNVPPHALVVGNPARVVRYLDTDQPAQPRAAARAVGRELRVAGVRLVPLTDRADLRGRLVAAELADDLPFVPARFFAVLEVPDERVRGEHAHRTCAQLLVALHGSVRCLVDDGHRRDEITLGDPATALYVPPLVWASQYRYSADAVLGVFASHPYDPDDYIRDYEQYRQLVGAPRG